MPLITTIQQLQKYVRVAYTSQQTVTLPNMEIADETYLWPALGEELYSAVLDSDSSAEADMKRLRELCCRVVAPLAVHDYMPRKQVTISDIGIHSKVTENDTPATRWAFNKLQASLQNDACKAMEALYVFLLKKKEVFSWKSPAVYPEALFTSGAEFSQYFNLYQPHRVFDALLPEIAQVQDHYLYPGVGRELVKELMALESPNEKQAEALRLMRAGVANLSVMKACLKLSVRFTAQGFTVLIGEATDQDYQGDNNAPARDKQEMKQAAEEDGYRYLAQLKDYLTTNADDFPTFKSSSLYKAPDGSTPIDDNRCRSGVFAIC